MGDPLGSYPLSSGKQGTLFQRNPVCRLSFRVCTDMCEEYGGLGFNLMKSLDVADQVCAKMVQNAWEPDGVDYYYQWIENQLNNTPAVMCACATVYVSIYVMEDAPPPLRAVGNDMKGLIFGEANRILENLRAAAYNEDITLSVTSYGQPPLESPTIQENRELKKQNNQLIRQVIAAKKQIRKMSKDDLQQQFMELLASGKVQPSTVVLGDNIEKQINIDKIEKDAIHINMSSPGMSSQQTEDVTSTVSSRTKKLFVSSDGDMDFQRLEEERNRFLNYLTDHCLSKEILNSSQDNPILKAIICFCARWKALHFIDPKISAVAVVRFLTETCGIPFDGTSERAISNALARMLQKDYDKDIYYDVQEYF